jgi:hypothetical protein
MRVGLTTSGCTPTPIERAPHKRLLSEVEALRRRLHHVEMVAYIALAIGAGLLAGILVVIVMALVR